MAKVTAAGKGNSLDYLLFVLYSYTTYVGMVTACSSHAQEDETCDFGEYVLKRFL